MAESLKGQKAQSRKAQSSKGKKPKDSKAKANPKSSKIRNPNTQKHRYESRTTQRCGIQVTHKCGRKYIYKRVCDHIPSTLRYISNTKQHILNTLRFQPTSNGYLNISGFQILWYFEYKNNSIQIGTRYHNSIRYFAKI